MKSLSAEKSSQKSIYEHDDSFLTGQPASPVVALQTLDELLERDVQREKDGFPKKVILGKIASPHGQKAVIVPSVTEEKFYHDNRPKTPGQGGDEGGSGEGEEGEIIGQAPVREDGQGQGQGGQGEGESHELDDSRAYEIGKALTEKFHLPNIQDKGKKTALDRYTYELTDVNRKFGQILDKKRSLKNILKTNQILGTFDPDNVNFDNIIVGPNDLLYRIVSPEKEYESQALVFFVRDYSGSMYGDATETVLSQHVLIYSWLLYQYQERVEKRFILHDTEAKEVDSFVKYYRLNNGGGTSIASAYKLVNQIVESEGLARDYNIYIFQGTDGDDWDEKGEAAIPEIEKMMTYVNRMGITIVKNSYSSSSQTYVERYIERSALLTKHPDLLRMTTLQGGSNSQDDLIKSIKALVE
ncbi:MAG: DUF444 family protein [Candidatus Riflebacteria bacterium]|nr:DUF444 family protein [Candidatus Riflebacteria bacterium]